jgi:hypothetical protein
LLLLREAVKTGRQLIILNISSCDAELDGISEE